MGKKKTLLDPDAAEKIAEQIKPELETQLLKQMSKGGHIVRWIACLDVLEENGDRSLVSVTSPGMEEWEYDGMSMNVPNPF